MGLKAAVETVGEERRVVEDLGAAGNWSGGAKGREVEVVRAKATFSIHIK